MNKVLKRFHMIDDNILSTTLTTNFKHSTLGFLKSKYEEFIATIPYSNVVGCVMYVTVCTKLDIAQATSIANRYMPNLEKAHWQVMNWTLRYLLINAPTILEYDT